MKNNEHICITPLVLKIKPNNLLEKNNFTTHNGEYRCSARRYKAHKPINLKN